MDIPRILFPLCNSTLFNSVPGDGVWSGVTVEVYVVGGEVGCCFVDGKREVVSYTDDAGRAFKVSF